MAALPADEYRTGGIMSRNQVGTMPGGAPVYEIGLDNGKGMKVNILTYGAIIKDIFVPDKDGNIGNVVLGQDTFEDVKNIKAWMPLPEPYKGE